MAAPTFESVAQARAAKESAARTLAGAQLAARAAAQRLDVASQSAQQAQAAAQQAEEKVQQLARAMYIAGPPEASSTMMLLDPGPQAHDAAVAAQYIDSSSRAVSEDLAATTAANATSQAELAAAQAADEQARGELQTAEAGAQAAAEQFATYLREYTPADGKELGDPLTCDNPLARRLARAGFSGEDLREAWAIAMRESGGNEKSISPTQDYGVFQINKPTWGSQDWWDDEAMLTSAYNIAMAYKMSDGGRSWLPWGLDGHGRANPLVYERSGWTEQQILDWIVEPYAKWYEQYPCLAQPATPDTPAAAS